MHRGLKLITTERERIKLYNIKSVSKRWRVINLIFLCTRSSLFARLDEIN